jgi:hypothetical protein
MGISCAAIMLDCPTYRLSGSQLYTGAGRQVRDRQERARLDHKKAIPSTGGIATSRSSCSPLQRWPTFATKPTPRRPQKRSVAPAATGSSIQEILHVATHLALKQIQQAYIIAIAWSLWRRSHQAAAQQTHTKSKMQL